LIVETGDVSFSLTDTSLTGLGNDTLSSIEKADLTGGPSANTFSVSKWTGSAKLDAQLANDQYFITFNTSSRGAVNIADSSGADDRLEVRGTTVADTIDVVTGKVTRGPQEVTYSGIEAATVNGKLSNDTIKVGSTSGVPLTVQGDSGADQIEVGLGNLANIQAAVFVEGGTNIDKLLASDANDTTNNAGTLAAGKITGLGLGASGIAFNTAVENVEIYLGSGDDDFLVLAVQQVFIANVTGTTIFAGPGSDETSVGSTPATDLGDLDAIRTTLTLIGGADDGGALETRDQVYVNDRNNAEEFNYKLTPTSLTDDPNDDAAPRTFAGIRYDGTTEYFRLDGTDEKNVFDVGPSPDTKYFIDGNLPAPGTCCPDDGDFLKLDTKTIPAPDRLLKITGRGEGSWTFPVTMLKDVQFESIEKFNHVDIVAVGADVASKGTSRPSILVLDAENNRVKFRIPASATYGVNNKYGIRLAVADIDGDGLPDVITAPGRNTRPDIKVFLGTPQVGLEGALFASIAASRTFGNNYKDGVNITAGDVDGDCMPEIILAQERGAGTIKVFHNAVLDVGATSAFPLTPRTFNPFTDIRKYNGGATLAVANLDGDDDNILELIVGTGAGVAAKVRTFSLTGTNPVRLTTFNDPSGFKQGLFVGGGDVDGDGTAEIITATGSGGGSRLRVFTAAGIQLKTFQAFTLKVEVPNSPLRMTIRDADDDGKADIYVMQGQDGRSNYRLKKFNALNASIIDTIFATDVDFAGGGVNLG
jgi:hypothetical protein